jgi:glycosyltransferase involved in cell wall biosynthesis
MSADHYTSGTIAVVIPCHDDGATLEEAVGSVLAQDVAAEIIVVDDGSSDPATEAVLARVEAAGVRVLRQTNRGPGPARMAGWRATRAEYALPLDADDRLAPGALRRLRSELERNPRAVAAWGSARHFGSLDFVQPSLPSLDPWQLTYQNHLPLSALYRREAVLRAGGWQLDGGYEDWDLWLTLAESGFEGVGIPVVTGAYRVQPGRRISRSAGRHGERCEILRRRHARLYAERHRHRRASPAPRMLKVALPLIDALPLSPQRKRLLAGAACYLANGAGLPTIAARMRAHKIRRAH